MSKAYFTRIPLYPTNRYIIVDTETTGFSEADHLVEVAAIEVKDGFITGRQFHAFIKPRKKMHLNAKKTHKMDDDFYSKNYEGDYKDEKTIMQNLLEFIGDSLIITHNSRFDSSFLNNELRYNNFSGFPEERFRCTMLIFQNLFAKQLIFKNYYKGSGLKDACDFFSIKVHQENLHNALYDATLAAKLLIKILEFFAKNPEYHISEKFTDFEYIFAKKEGNTYKENTRLSSFGFTIKPEELNNSQEKKQQSSIYNFIANSIKKISDNKIINKSNINTNDSVSANSDFKETTNLEDNNKVINITENSIIKNSNIVKSEPEAARLQFDGTLSNNKKIAESENDEIINSLIRQGRLTKEELDYNVNSIKKKYSLEPTDEEIGFNINYFAPEENDCKQNFGLDIVKDVVFEDYKAEIDKKFKWLEFKKKNGIKTPQINNSKFNAAQKNLDTKKLLNKKRMKNN